LQRAIPEARGDISCRFGVKTSIESEI